MRERCGGGTRRGVTEGESRKKKGIRDVESSEGDLSDDQVRIRGEEIEGLWSGRAMKDGEGGGGWDGEERQEKQSLGAFCEPLRCRRAWERDLGEGPGPVPTEP